MSDDLVQRVALVICEDAGMEHQCRIACAICKVDARAAIAVCMEEAAKALDRRADLFRMSPNGVEIKQCAAAIRALVKEDKV